MFTTEILGRCSTFEQRVANIYKQFAHSLPNDEAALRNFWLGLSEEEQRHARILAAEKAALEVEADPGYFLPEYPAKLVALDAMLKKVEEKSHQGVAKDEAFNLALDLEQSELNMIYRDLVMTGRTALKLQARNIAYFLALPLHQQNLVEGVTRFLPANPTQQRAQTWLNLYRIPIR